MKQGKYCVRALLLIATLLTSLIVPSGMASAASDYDDAYRTTSTIALSNDGWSPYYTACAREDYTASWTSAMLAAPQMTTPYINSFNEALENGRWGVSGVTSTSYGHIVEGFIVYWTEDTSLQLNWSEAYSGHIVSASGGASFHSVLVRNHNAQTSGSDCSPHAILAGASLVSTSTDTVNNPDDVRNLFVRTDHPNYPTGYGGALVRTELPAAKYVAMGDSFSSGEGNSPFEYGTNQDGVNECHRSSQAYPRLLQSSLSLGSIAFAACAGAMTTNITDGQWNEPAQLDVLTNETEIVTLSIGGNDAGFSYYVQGCVAACGPGTLVYTAMMNAINQPAFKANLVYTFEEILEAAPNADLYVADYPHLAAENATRCLGLDFSGAYDIQEALNEVIRDAVTEVDLNSNRIFMVETNYSGSPFEGGHLCNGGLSLFNGLVPVDPEYSLHPNANGHLAYAEVFEEYINS